MTTVRTGTQEPTAIGANDQDLAAGHEVGEYRVERVLGRGGFGTVYAGVQPLIGKHVAIKVLSRKFSSDPAVVSRFVAEARAVNQIGHRNIIDIFSFGELADGRHYYVMEYLAGQPLDAYIRDYGAMPLEDALPVLRAIARALDAAHAKGIAHRDLKPENIFLANDPDGGVFPKLLDFGIAKLLTPEDDVRHKTGTGVPIGTPYYMSPEQCRGRDVDHRTDMYSFGIVIYRLLTGTFPFEGDDYVDLLFKQVNEEPQPPSARNPALPPAVDTAIGWMMRKDREQRPRTVLEGVHALDPSQAITAPNPLARGSRPSVAPRMQSSAVGATVGALDKTSSPDALAATYTPQFEKPERPAITLPDAAPAAARKRWPVFAAVGVLLVGAGIAAVMLARGGSPAKPETATPTPPAKTDPPGVAVPGVTPDPGVKIETPVGKVEVPLPPPLAADTPSRVQITFSGVPDRATVLRDGNPLGVTPKLTLPYGTATVDLVLQLDGYDVATVSLTPDKDKTVNVTMRKKPRSQRPKGPDDVEAPRGFGP